MLTSCNQLLSRTLVVYMHICSNGGTSIHWTGHYSPVNNVQEVNFYLTDPFRT